jgi:hypothetical protein
MIASALCLFFAHQDIPRFRQTFEELDLEHLKPFVNAVVASEAISEQFSLEMSATHYAVTISFGTFAPDGPKQGKFDQIVPLARLEWRPGTDNVQFTFQGKAAAGKVLPSARYADILHACLTEIVQQGLSPQHPFISGLARLEKMKSTDPGGPEIWHLSVGPSSGIWVGGVLVSATVEEAKISAELIPQF